MTFPISPFTETISAEEVVSTMKGYTGWEDKYRQVIQWGKKLPVMPDELKTTQVLVAGCESQVWLVSEQINGRWFFCADSDARIVRGLIALVMAALDGATESEILSFDIEDYFDQLGLIEHLSASRGNGLRAIVETIIAQVRAKS